ncbi:hypothetical protein BG011_010227 [Mortierella polycephala]|uniref:Uncharacterized protein n=1 Tax=Mortierella polycephala TaxID=41804 RepID=A0A9P6TVK3_9FUNG|nr:hypothetical protein BG011_010227 [Mortierella polycephala]
MAPLYRFTHRAIDLVSDDQPGRNDVPTEISLANLTMFSTILFMNEFHKMGLGGSVDVSKTCNRSEWHRRIYAGTTNSPMSDEDEYVDIMSLPPKPLSQAGLIYATTHKANEAGQDSKEAFSSFLFAHHKSYIAKTVPSSTGASTELSPEAQARIADRGVTHIWLCGSDPELRRHRLMSSCLSQLEKDVLQWKIDGQGSGVMTVHTIPGAFPGMVQFLIKNGFKGGDKVMGGDSEKVLYWKEL